MVDLNKDAILQFYKLLRHKNQTELRAIIPKIETRQHHFKTAEELISLCEKYNGTHNLYLGVNERKENGTGKGDIISVGVIPIDIDCVNKPASADDLAEAKLIATRIIREGLFKGFKEPPLIASGNGFQILFCIPKIDINDNNREEIDAKIKEFENRLINKYSTEQVRLDQVGDLPRIMRIAGTYNLKSKTLSSFIKSDFEEDEKLKEEILTLEFPKIEIVPRERHLELATTYFENEPSITDIWMPDKCKRRGSELFGEHPVHGSDGGQNFWINSAKGLWTCFRHGVGGDWWSAIAVKEGLIDCSEAQRGKIRGDLAKKVLEIAQEKYGLKIKPNLDIASQVFERIKASTKTEKEEKKDVEQKVEHKETPHAYAGDDADVDINNEDIEEVKPEVCDLKDINIAEVREQTVLLKMSKRKEDATELLVNVIKERCYIYTTKNDIQTEVWIYNNGIYTPNGKSEIKKILRCILGAFFTTNFFNEVLAKIEADTFIEADDFFKTRYPNEIPLLNGILNIETRVLTPYNPKKIFFNKLPITYNKEAKCPNIEKHFEVILKNPEDIKVMYEIIGYCLARENFLEKAVMFVGNGRNGKTKTLELIHKFIGEKNASALSLTQIAENSFELSELFGKMVNLAGDISSTALKETGGFKKVVGRDVINAKRKFLPTLSFTNYAVSIFACNELPKVYDTTDGFWDKWLLFDFPYKFVPQSELSRWTEVEQEQLKFRLLNPNHILLISTPEELSGLLNKALDRLDYIKKKKEFSYSRGVEEVRREWIRKADSFQAFVMDNLEDAPEDFRLDKNILKKVYHNYCKKYKVKGVSTNSYRITLEETFGVGEMQDSYGVRHWTGVKFKKDAEFHA
jgi:putative DNA primase/helicase